ARRAGRAAGQHAREPRAGGDVAYDDLPRGRGIREPRAVRREAHARRIDREPKRTPAFARGRLRIDAPGADLARTIDREQRRAVGEGKNRDNAAPGREARELGPAARVEHAQRASRVEQREVAAARAEPPALDVA